MKNTQPVRYFGELQQLPNGKFKVIWAERKQKINQNASHWVRVNSRELARKINRNSLVIK